MRHWAASLLFAVFFLASWASPLVSWARLQSTGAASVSFLAIGPFGTSIRGQSSELTATEKEEKLTVSVPIAPIKTGIALRDRHMREHLGAAEHPNAVLKVARSSLKVPEKGGSTSGKVSGTFELKGVSKPKAFSYTAKHQADGTIAVSGKMDVDIREHGIKVPSYLGVTVQPEVKVEVSFTLVDK